MDSPTQSYLNNPVDKIPRHKSFDKRRPRTTFPFHLEDTYPSPFWDTGPFKDKGDFYFGLQGEAPSR